MVGGPGQEGAGRDSSNQAEVPASGGRVLLLRFLAGLSGSLFRV